MLTILTSGAVVAIAVINKAAGAKKVHVARLEFGLQTELYGCVGIDAGYGRLFYRLTEIL